MAELGVSPGFMRKMSKHEGLNMIETKCPYCGTEVNVEEELVGEVGQCPSCLKYFTISGSKTLNATSSKPRPPLPKMRRASSLNALPPISSVGATGGKWGDTLVLSALAILLGMIAFGSRINVPILATIGAAVSLAAVDRLIREIKEKTFNRTSCVSLVLALILIGVFCAIGWNVREEMDRPVSSFIRTGF